MTIRIQPPGADLFGSFADLLVNPVNTKGVMGAGLAAQFRKRFPEMFPEYRRRCLNGRVRVGEVDVHRLSRPGEAPGQVRRIYIANVVTKRDWRDPSRLDWVESGLASLARVVVHLRVGSVAVPALGCGLGGLDWTVVKPRIIAAMTPVSDAGVEILIFAPSN